MLVLILTINFMGTHFYHSLRSLSKPRISSVGQLISIITAHLAKLLGCCWEVKIKAAASGVWLFYKCQLSVLEYEFLVILRM